MATVKFQGLECKLEGNFPKVGDMAPDFELTSASLGVVTKKEFEGKNILLNIFPSLDTGVCAASVRRFNKEAEALENTVVVCASMDLPFAMGRFCTAEGIEGVVPASAFRSPEFGKSYGVALVDGPLRGLLTRAVVVISPDGKVAYAQLVDEITNDPDFDGALNALKQL